ncbi:hypothetical protein ACX12M_17065 [Cellulosimicrobium cellulans]
MSELPEDERQAMIRCFIDTVEDLRSRVRLTASYYDLMQASGLLRRLLMDGKALGPRASSHLQMRPTFTWYPIARWDGRKFMLTLYADPKVAQALLPEGGITRPGGKPSTGTVQDLLSMEIAGGIVTDSGPVIHTVRDLISQLANDEGGVHMGMARVRHQMISEGLVDSPRQIELAVLAIGRIVVAGYEPLVLKALERDPDYGLSPQDA